jgi:DUF4097 and DUF4098 domain-containing protein YvlB
MKNRLFLLGLMLAISFMTSGQNKLNKSFSGIKKIRMNTASGDCKIQKSSSTSVTVNLNHTFDDPNYQPTAEQDGDRLVIKETFRGNNSSGSSTWTLSVPDGIEITFNTGSGNLEVSGLNLTMDITTGSGDLFFTNIKGDIDGTTGSGNIELDNTSGKIKTNTGSGNIRVLKSHGEISVNCGSGNVKVSDSQATFTANTGSGDITARNLVIDGSSRFNTGSGSAEVVLGATPKFDLSVNSGSGDAELNFNGNEIKGEIVMKASKKHGKIIAPFEFDKTEETNEWGDNTVIEKTTVKGNAANRISVGTGSGTATLKQ